MTAKSRPGWVNTYANCPISWASKLQSKVAFSTTGAKDISHSTALCDVIQWMQLFNELITHTHLMTFVMPWTTILVHWNLHICQR